jgi:hypothetical protein
LVRPGRYSGTSSLPMMLDVLTQILISPDGDIGCVLQGCQPIDILFVRRSGRRSGEVFVVFASAADLEQGLSKNMSHLGERYIEVMTAKKTVSRSMINNGLCALIKGYIHYLAGPCALIKGSTLPCWTLCSD